MSVQGEKTPKFVFYIFALGTLILILDSNGPPAEMQLEEKRSLLCRFYQLHLPRHAIQIALHHRPETVGPSFKQALTHLPRKDVVHFLLDEASDEISEMLSRDVEDGSDEEDRTDSLVSEILL